MAISQYYVDPAIAGDSGTGAIGDPFGDLQYALNTITRNATDGDQVNVKAGTPEVLAATLTLATYGTPTATAPLVLRGYTSTADDGGVGVIDGAAAYGVLSTTTDYVHLLDLRITNSGAAFAVSVRNYCNVQNCEIDTGTSGGVNNNGSSIIERNYIHDFSGNSGIYNVGGLVSWNYILRCGSSNVALVCINPGSSAYWNIVIPNANRAAINVQNHQCRAVGNIAYVNGSTAAGISSNASLTNLIITNNIVVGFSGAGGKGISVPATCVMAQYYGNAAYNNTTNFDVAAKFLGVTGGNVALAADPFTDAANGDFSLTTAALAALRSAGWPSSYLGAHANTDPHITIGALQYGPTPTGGGGAVSISPFRGNF